MFSVEPSYLLRSTFSEFLEYSLALPLKQISDTLTIQKGK